MSGVKNINPNERKLIESRKEENKVLLAEGKAKKPATILGIRTINFSAFATEDGDVFEESLVSDMSTPEEIFRRKQALALVIGTLSPLAELVVDWLRNPPEELMREISCRKAHMTLRENAGFRRTGPYPSVNLDMVFDFLKTIGDVSTDEIKAVKAELKIMTDAYEEKLHD